MSRAVHKGGGGGGLMTTKSAQEAAPSQTEEVDDSYKLMLQLTLLAGDSRETQEKSCDKKTCPCQQEWVLCSAQEKEAEGKISR